MSETVPEGSALLHECRAVDPNAPREIGVTAAAEQLGVKISTLYGWLYTKKVAGERRGKTWFVPAAEMARLIDLKERGVLDGTMRAWQGGKGMSNIQRGMSNVEGKKPAGVKPVKSKAVKVKRVKIDTVVTRGVGDAIEPVQTVDLKLDPDPRIEMMVTLKADDLVNVIRLTRELTAILDPLGVQLYPTVR